MAVVVSLARVKPAARFDDVPYETAIIRESADGLTGWTDIETIALTPDADPSAPSSHNFTTNAATSADYFFRVKFVDADLNFSLTDVVSPTGYPTTEALVAASQVESLTGLTEDQQDALRSSAIVAVEAFTGQVFDLFEGEIEVTDVQCGDEVYLPRRLIEVGSITPFDGDALDLDPILLTSNGERLLWRSNVVGVGYYEQALFEVSGRDYPTKFQTGTLVVDGTWGWATVPDAVVAAIRMDMEDQALADDNAMSTTVTAMRKLGIKGWAQGNLRIEFDGTRGGAGEALTQRVQRQLAPYVFLGRLGRMA